MTKFTPTPEQQAIIDAAVSTEDNLLISALAGAAKTSTLELIAHALRNTSMLCLAFNVRIAKEMGERLPPNCECRTLNSMGHRIWGDTIGKRLIVDDKKMYRLLKDACDRLKGDDKDEAYSKFSDMLQALREGKTGGWIPDYSPYRERAKPLIDDADFFGSLDEEPSELIETILINVMSDSLGEAFQGKIDYDDQILMPAVFQALFPRPPLVLVDEAQDLSGLNHRFLSKLVKKRIIAVGDECQSIYAFRGASENSMRELQQQFSMRELVLSVSFRCPIKVVEEALWRAPHMRYPEWAKEGTVSHVGDWDATLLPDDAVILCRNNAPLFSMAFKLLRSKRYPQLVGNDLGKSLIKTLKSLGPDNTPQADVLASIERWKVNKMLKARNPTKVEDQAACLTIFAEQGKTLADAVAYAEHILNISGPVKLMTIHKSKGLEWDNIFILDRDLIRDHQQDKNLLYVGQTRSKSTLTYIRSDMFELPETDPHVSRGEPPPST